MIRATTWHEGSVIPAKAGIHPLPPLDAGLRRHDESGGVQGGCNDTLKTQTSYLLFVSKP
jgi:hypothetical protein